MCIRDSDTTAVPDSATRSTESHRYSLSLDDVIALREQGNVIPIYREIMADLETPVSAYLKAVSYTHLTLPTSDLV